MKSDRLENMFRGWFVGAFTPTVLHTDACEVAIQHYAKGDYESCHMHKVATEITAVVEGSVRMFDREWNAGDIITIPPGEATDFLALTDAITVVVKYPGALNDKYVMDME
jgi:quercetin dioxygenase-like cupin family protein